jgi:hypothetical protein
MLEGMLGIQKRIDLLSDRGASRLDVRPALFLQFHDTHNTGLHDGRLGNNGNFLVFGLVHIFLGIAAGFEGNCGRALRDRLDPRLDR